MYAAFPVSYLGSKRDEPEIRGSNREKPEILGSNRDQPEILGSNRGQPEILGSYRDQPEILGSSLLTYSRWERIQQPHLLKTLATIVVEVL